MEREDGDDLVAVDGVPVGVDREHAVAVPVEGDAEVQTGLCDSLLQSPEIGGAAAQVDVRSVRLVADGDDLRAQLLERPRSEAGVGAVRAVDPDPEAGQVRPEALDDVLEVAVGRDADPVDLAAADRGSVEERLDLLLGLVGQLLPVAVEELDAVELRRVVGGRDDDAQVEREQRDGRSRQDAGEDRAAAGRDDSRGERLLELGARGARVAADEDPPAAGPQRGGAPEPLDEVCGEDVADDPTHAVRAEVAPRHGA